MSHSQAPTRGYVPEATTLAAAALFLLFAVFGLLYRLAEGSRPASIFLSTLHHVAMAFLLYTWASHDASRHARSLSGTMIVCIVLFGVFSVPFYLSRYRSPARWARWLGTGIAIFVACGVVYVLLFELAAGWQPGP